MQQYAIYDHERCISATKTHYADDGVNKMAFPSCSLIGLHKYMCFSCFNLARGLRHVPYEKKTSPTQPLLIGVQASLSRPYLSFTIFKSGLDLKPCDFFLRLPRPRLREHTHRMLERINRLCVFCAGWEIHKQIANFRCHFIATARLKDALGPTTEYYST